MKYDRKIRRLLKKSLVVCGGILILLLSSINPVSAKTLVAIVSDRSAADLAAGADYFQRRNGLHQLVFRSSSQISRMSDTEVHGLFEKSDAIVTVAIFGDTAVRLQAILPRYTSKVFLGVNSTPALVRHSRDFFRVGVSGHEYRSVQGNCASSP